VFGVGNAEEGEDDDGRQGQHGKHDDQGQTPVAACISQEGTKGFHGGTNSWDFSDFPDLTGKRRAFQVNAG